MIEKLAPTDRSRASTTRSRLVFHSAVDTWLAVLLALPIVGSAAIAFYLIAMGRPDDASLLFLIAAVNLAVTMAFTVPCRYTLLEDTLSVRCGLICYQVPYETITEVQPSSTLVSGPALSLRRVVIQTERRKHILSPADRERFIAELQSRL